MNALNFNAVTHISIVWGVTLAVLTLIEWNSLDRDPMREQIFSPFIGRDVSVLADDESLPGNASADAPDSGLRYQVEFHFNGPLFLAYFFVPILALRIGAGLIARVRGSGLPPSQ